MSENRWEAARPDNNMWWPGAAEQHHQHYLQQQQQQQLAHQQHQQQQMDAAATATNVPTTDSNVSSTSPQGAANVRGGAAASYDYSRPGDGGMTGGNPPMNMPAPAAQWWYPPSSIDSMHATIQNMQQQQNMPPAQTPPPSQTDTQARQDETQRHQQQQEADRHREVQRQHQEAQRQHQEALQHHHQAIAEAQARHHQLQQQAQQLQHQQLQQHHQLQNNHHHQQVLQQQHQIVSKVGKGRMSRGKDGSKPRGPMTAYAFFVQTCREEHKKQHPEENVVFLEFSKKCAERWKMVDKEKKRFQEMAENDKKRYDAEMQNYIPPKGEKVRGKKRKQMKDPNAPKRSLSAFFWFSNDERGKVKAQNPEYGVGDIAKELGRRWADADSEMKGKYEQLAAKDKARYDIEMTAYKQKNNPTLPKPPLVVPEHEPVEDDDDEGDDYDDE